MAALFARSFVPRSALAFPGLRCNISHQTTAFARRSPQRHAPKWSGGASPSSCGPSASQKRFYRNPPFRYQQFKRTQGIFTRWAARPTFYYEVGGIAGACGVFYVYNLEPVPVSGRRRFNLISPEYEQQMGLEQYKQIIAQYQRQIYPPYSTQHRQVQRILDRLVPHSGLSDTQWEVHVIDSPEANAFVIPGGKVFVFSGILPLTQTDDGLAAVLGHEIAHNVARHTAERMSQLFVVMPVAIVGSLLVGLDVGIGRTLANLAFTLPGSRAQEQEADYIGLLMMAQSCYDPDAAVAFWARMEEAQKGEPPQFLSTHPSNHNRMDKIRAWLPEAQEMRANSDCKATSQYAHEFSQLVDFSRW